MLCSTALRAAAIWQSASCERALTCSSHPTADGMRFLIPRAMLSAPESSPPRHAEAQCGATPIDDFMARAVQWLCVARSPRLDCPPPGARQLAKFGFSVASCSSCAREYVGVGADMEHVRRERHSSMLLASVEYTSRSTCRYKCIMCTHTDFYLRLMNPKLACAALESRPRRRRARRTGPGHSSRVSRPSVRPPRRQGPTRDGPQGARRALCPSGLSPWDSSVDTKVFMIMLQLRASIHAMADPATPATASAHG